MTAALMVSTAAAAAAATDQQIESRVRAALVSHHLVKNPDCIDYSITRNVDPGVDEVEILERHDATCGGNPQIVHRLFDVLIDQKTHRIATDAADPIDGRMSALD